ncbi:uncharacterized protein LOC129720036 [Wyeomyia smithii]|uniref:uncharacterized protein LOC129720036 n=1 Tax=Wyeomyia smithii TaxID=174621 RepID=UPI002467D231|nr:uncharacterized protein LOC129720036 [Wyeomyia smithii]
MNDNIFYDENHNPVDYDVSSVNNSDQYFIEALSDADDPLICPPIPPLDRDDGAGNSIFNIEKRNCYAKNISECDRKTNLSMSASFYKRRFVGETSGSLIASQTLIGDTVEEILQHMWTIVQPVIYREVVFIEDNGNQAPIWADNEPSYEDMQKFVYLQNNRRRRINIEQIDSKLLISLSATDVRVHVHVYSTAVSCKQLWDLVDKQLVRFQDTDRAGAPNNQSLSALANELRKLHGHHFTGHASLWKLWANNIHTVPAHAREQKMSELPPYFIIKFFRSVPISEAVQLESSRNGLSVANTINTAFSTELAVLEKEADQLISLGQRVKHRISALRARTSINLSLLSAMQESMGPQENEVSRSLADNVLDLEDIDHA